MQHEDNRSDSLASRDGEEDRDMPPPKRRRTGNGVNASASREVGVMRNGVGSSSASFVGSASGIHFIRSVYNAMGTSTAENTSPAAADIVPGEDDRLGPEIGSAGRKSIWLDHEVIEINSSSANLTFDNLTEWTSSYFDAWHPIFPFLHAPTVLESFETTTQVGITNLDQFDAVIIRSLHSLSLADRRQSPPSLPPVPSTLVFLTFDEALSSVQPALTQPATIKALQAVTCVQLFLISMLRLNAASRLGGLIVQMAFQLGLHRCPVRFEAFSQEEGQLRKRLFWSIYCLERYLCQALGLPLLIRDEDVDVCFLNKELHGTPKSQGNNTDVESSQCDRRLQLLAFLTQHAQLRGAIIELRNKKVQERDRNPDAAILINARLTQWWNNVGDFMDQQPTDSTVLSDLHRAILNTLKHESIIMLNRPLLALSKNAANYSAAIHTCIGAAKSILTTLTSLNRSSDVSSTPALPMIWPSFTWATWMSAFIMFYASAEGKIDRQVANRNITKSLELLKGLAKRGSVWPQACAVAIEDLSSNMSRQKGTSLTNPARRPTHAPVADARPGSSSLGRSHFQLDDRSQSIFSQAAVHDQSGNGASTDVLPTRQATAVPSGCFEASSNSIVQSQNHEPNVFDTFADNSLPIPPDLTTDLNDNSSWQNLSFLSKAMPQMSPAGGDPLLGFDIPFWMGQDNYIAWMNDAG